MLWHWRHYRRSQRVGWRTRQCRRSRFDAVKLQRARAWAKEKQLTNVEFFEANAFDTGLPPHSFDLVHSRFAISVIQNGLGILDHMLTLVRPNGIVFVEEANTHTLCNAFQLRRIGNKP
jgi:ubiquinone/menaquinone biosynthesis C-methylase UbiE